ncbi:FMN-binding negative transcriptional regulator [Lacinutrix salivirga]
MNYPPKQHQDNNKQHLIEVITSYPLATIISVKNNTPLITHLPLIYDDKSETLTGHIDIYNPQTPLLKDNNDVTILFSGPQCYISPSIYTTKQLPTWNYIKVHLKGKVKAIEDREQLKESLIAMTHFLEAPQHNYSLDANNKQMEAALDYIKLFEISIKTWEGKFKLSQDKKTIDTANAKAELIRANQNNIASFINRVLTIN